VQLTALLFDSSLWRNTDTEQNLSENIEKVVMTEILMASKQNVRWSPLWDTVYCTRSKDCVAIATDRWPMWAVPATYLYINKSVLIRTLQTMLDKRQSLPSTARTSLLLELPTLVFPSNAERRRTKSISQSTGIIVHKTFITDRSKPSSY
jgi:hypothetical protein